MLAAISKSKIDLPLDAIQSICRNHGIRRLALFGSVLRSDFKPTSDVDMLVEFEPSKIPGLIAFAGFEQDLSALIGRKIDLNTPGFFNPTHLAHIEKIAETLYENFSGKFTPPDVDAILKKSDAFRKSLGFYADHDELDNLKKLGRP